MDRISELSDELLIKILSLLPTKLAVSTSLLSKRWEYLWMWLPNLDFGNGYYSEFEWKRFRRFLDRNLPLYKAPIIDSFRLVLSGGRIDPLNVNLWVGSAISRRVRELEIVYDTFRIKSVVFPSNLYTCESLVTLKLVGEIILDVPRMVSLPLLKTLELRKMGYFNDKSLQRLLSNSPVLEDLVVELRPKDITRKLSVVVPSLLRLSLSIPYFYSIDGVVMETPSLKYFKLKDENISSHYYLIGDMPNLVEAYLDVQSPNINKIIGSVTSVKRLTICTGDVYTESFVLKQLEHLGVCRCQEHSSDLLLRLLKYSSNLQVLDLFVMEEHFPVDIINWNQPSTVPECMLSSLQIVNWSSYKGKPEEKDLAVYILKNALPLNTITITFCESAVPECEMIRELELRCRASPTCQLIIKCQ